MADCDENAMSSRCRSGGEGTTRGSAEYLPLDEPFHANLRDRAANGQYANLYFARLAKLRPAVQQQMAAKWGLSEARLREMQSKTLDVPEEAECIVLGTFYAEMKLKPNVLEEYTRDPLAAAAPVPDKYCGPGDKLIIEDETGRLVISGALVTQAKLVTGVVLAVRGQLDPATSIFAVNDICIADMSAQPPLPASVTLTESVRTHTHTYTLSLTHALSLSLSLSLSLFHTHTHTLTHTLTHTHTHTSRVGTRWLYVAEYRLPSVCA
ncbi:hypothetical protein T492DRAFT_57863 [Pavlovales sp. CCMP2436]|nr:hypothetical protein T492DRAFT_57863 [Pavlovales sp. CCMP2436]